MGARVGPGRGLAVSDRDSQTGVGSGTELFQALASRRASGASGHARPAQPNPQGAQGRTRSSRWEDDRHARIDIWPCGLACARGSDLAETEPATGDGRSRRNDRRAGLGPGSSHGAARGLSRRCRRRTARPSAKLLSTAGRFGRKRRPLRDRRRDHPPRPSPPADPIHGRSARTPARRAGVPAGRTQPRQRDPAERGRARADHPRLPRGHARATRTGHVRDRDLDRIPDSHAARAAAARHRLPSPRVPALHRWDSHA